MTDRTITTAIATETISSPYRRIEFLSLAFSTPIFIWTGIGSITLAMPGEASQTWIGIGDAGSISSVRESSGRRVNGVTLGLSQVNTSLFQEALNQNYQDKSVKIWEAFLDNNYVIVADPILIFSGLMDTMTISDGDPNGSIVLQCESKQTLLQRTSRSLLTDQEQQRLHPGDVGLNFVAGLQHKKILWGVPNGVGDTNSRRGNSSDPGNIDNSRRSFQTGF